MAYCEKCGAQIKDNAEFCTSCGASTRSQAEINDAEANRIPAIISYIGLLILVPLIKGNYRNSPFLKFHLNQAIVFCIFWFAGGIIGVIPYIGIYLLGIEIPAVAALEIYCIICAAKGKMTPIPIISDIKIIK